MDAVTVAALARAISDPSRVAVYELADGKTCISEIAQQLGVTSATVSHHVRVLRDAGFVDVCGYGRRHHPRRTEDACRMLVRALALGGRT
jgi:ArsR family transcriptional regulator